LVPEPLPDHDPLLREHFVLPLLDQLRSWSDAAREGRRRLPLIGLNGPVGAGKTSLGRQLEALAPRFGLRLCVASIDDLYLSWPERGERLAGNPFSVSRVPPGSHDLPLLQEALSRWRQSGILRLPCFDKTLAAGQGDRNGLRERICDGLVLEGWLIGCRPLADTCLTARIEAAMSCMDADQEWIGVPGDLRGSGCAAPALRCEEWRWLPHWNRELEGYLPIWQACDGLWLLRPLHWGLPRRWRFQAEARQRRAGGGWLPPEALDRLVRASLCSLPPALYQEPLTHRLSLPALTFGEWPGPAEPSEAMATNAASGTWLERTCTAGASRETGRLSQATHPHQDGRPCADEPPVQAVAWLDGRRRCRSLRLQASLSPSSSATG